MNANEVIANLAGDEAHANDHVNMGQSSNDVFPSAVHLAAVDAVRSEPAAGARAPGRLVPAQGRRVGRRRQGGPHPHDGRGAGDARPGVRRLRGADHARPRPRAGRARPRRGDPAGRHRHRHGPQHAPRVRRARAREARPRRGAARPLRGPGQPRRAGRAARRAQGRRRVADQDRQRPRADGLGPAHRPRRAAAARAPEGLVDHAGQGQPGDPRGRAPGRRAGDRQRHGRHGGGHPGRLRAERARSR